MLDSLGKLLKGDVYLLVVGLVVAGLIAVANVVAIKKRLFAFFYTRLFKGYQDALVIHKRELFAPLRRHYKSLDVELRQLRILEIGVGPGANFEFYPKNARIVAVDPNRHFKKQMEDNLAKFPTMKLERFVEGEGEHLEAVADSSVDVVVTTTVLCSVNSVKAMLAEILRVLAPGGTYFFLEHAVSSSNGHSQREIDNDGPIHGHNHEPHSRGHSHDGQNTNTWLRHFLKDHVLATLWPLHSSGVNKDTTTVYFEQAINGAGFHRTHFTKFSVTGLPKLLSPFIVKAHVFGTAQKSKST